MKPAQQQPPAQPPQAPMDRSPGHGDSVRSPRQHIKQEVGMSPCDTHGRASTERDLSEGGGAETISDDEIVVSMGNEPLDG